MIIFKLRKRARRKLEFEDVYTLEEHWSWLLSHYITKTCEPCKDGLHRPAINDIAPIITENILECDRLWVNSYTTGHERPFEPF
ncbi:hypothetical protein [Paenibacillus sp. B2(2019)]|uniref:hypothetical protein n=1 Tax=Paenibacillus sp. B2(2019) TaxID=2607754 RepID=UPI001CB6CF27|nr:hypothetical protein [Paenibacillus sp. B2(2019)]